MGVALARRTGRLILQKVIPIRRSCRRSYQLRGAAHAGAGALLTGAIIGQLEARLPDAKLVAGLDQSFLDRGAVEKGAVSTLEVLEEEALRRARNLYVVSRGTGIIDDNDVVRPAAYGQLRL